MKALKALALSAVSLLAMLSTSANADTLIHISGSTAYRSAVHNAIANLMTAGGGTCHCAYVGSTIAGANQAVFQGTISTAPSLGTVTVETSWNGSISGIAGMVSPSTHKFTFITAGAISSITVTPSAQSGFTTNFGVLPGAQASAAGFSNISGAGSNTETVACDMAFSDSFQSSTPFAASNGYTALTDEHPGVLPFLWMKNAAKTTDTDYANGGWGRLTNITALQAKYLIGAGYGQAVDFTGNTSDTYYVNLAGRDYDSGTRFDALAEAQLAGTAPVTQFGNTAIAVTGSGTGSAIVDNSNSETTSSLSTALPAVGGYNSGGKLVGAMQAIGTDGSNDFGGYIVCYAGASDADTVLGITSGGPTGYVAPTALTFNGVALTKTNVLNGTYSFWTYEHFLTNGTPAAGSFGALLYSQLLNTDAQVAGYRISDMKVSRSVEGGLISLQ
jgi:hypothetical protein